MSIFKKAVLGALAVTVLTAGINVAPAEASISSAPKTVKSLQKALEATNEYAVFNTGEVTAKEVSSILKELQANDPENYYLRNWAIQPTGKVTLQYTHTKSTVQKRTRAVEKAVAEALSKTVRQNDNQEQKVRAAHDYLANHIKFDKVAYRSNKAGAIQDTAYSALVLKNATGPGYAKAANLLFAEMGVQSLIVNGASNGGWHSWNMVKLGKAFYHVDIASDDQDLKNGKSIVTHDYFLITSTLIAKTHFWKATNYPFAYNTRYQKVDK